MNKLSVLKKKYANLSRKINKINQEIVNYEIKIQENSEIISGLKLYLQDITFDNVDEVQSKSLFDEKIINSILEAKNAYQNNKKLNSNITNFLDNNDFDFEELDINCQSACQYIDGIIYFIKDNSFYENNKQEILSWQHEFITSFSEILYIDYSGNFYVTGMNGSLYRTGDKGRTFKKVIDENRAGGSFKKIVVDKFGALYTGSYAANGPAFLYKSTDEGITWKNIYCFYTRHIHNIAYNFYNDFLYIVCGESKDEYKQDAYRIFRSKNYGKSFFPIVVPCYKKNRPLYLGISFRKNEVYLSSDHFEGNNFISMFNDDGMNRVFSPKKIQELFNIEWKRKNYYGFIFELVSFNKYLVGILTGNNESFLFYTTDGKSWSWLKLSGTYRYYETSPWNNFMLISGLHSTDKLLLLKCKNISECMIDKYHAKDIEHFILNTNNKFKEVYSRGFFYKCFETSEILITLINNYLNKNKIDKNLQVIDMGSGTGPFVFNFLKYGFRNITTNEASPRWLHMQRKLLQLYNADILVSFYLSKSRKHLDFPIYNSYDIISIMGVFIGNGNGLNLDDSFFRMAAHLKQNGIIFFNIHLKRTYQINSIDELKLILKRYSLFLENIITVSDDNYFCVAKKEI